MSTRDPTASITTYPCDDCGETFLTWQARNGHHVKCNPRGDE